MSQRVRKPARRPAGNVTGGAGDDRDFMLLALGLTYSLTILAGLVMVEVWKRC
jgi:hypothetical protein